MSQKRYLVTGGAGFIGANFVHLLCRRFSPAQADVTVVDALTYAGNIKNIAGLVDSGRVRFVHADIADAAAMHKVFDDVQPDFVVNFAAESHVDRSIADPRIFLQTNIMGTHTLLEAARRVWADGNARWQDGKKFVQISTDEVYGALPADCPQGTPVVLDDADRRVFAAVRNDIPVAYGTGFFEETTPLSPRSPYSTSKASADMLAMAYFHTYGLPVCVTRCSNNYGQMQFPEKLIPLVINNVLQRRPVPVYGNGLNVRDWLYVDDHCQAVLDVCQSGVPGQAYNIGGYNEKRNIDIVHTIIDTVARQTGTAAAHHLVRFVADRAGHDMRYAIKPSKIAARLQWAPRTTFDRGIELTVKWYLDNRDWLDSVTSGAYKEYYEKMYAHR